ncbi:MAG: flagellar biosynthesis anti-sigma factor FlgM [Ignavibacteria bacterium]
MKISSTVSPLGSATNDTRTRATPGAKRNATPSGAEVSLSPLSSKLQEIQASASADVDVVDTQRVSEIKQAIAEGRFKVNPERIADGLLASVREMLANKS